MAQQFPTALNSYAGTETLSAAGHAAAHNVLESKVGIDSSAVVSSLDYLVKSTSSSNPGHKHTLANGATDVTASYAELNILDGVTATYTQLNYLNGATGTTGTTTTNLVFSTSPTLVTPTLGVATVTSVNKITITAPATGATLTMTDGITATLPSTDTYVGRATTDTLTNKRITKRITTITSHATPTINTDNCDCVTITALAEAITSMTTNLSGTPTNFQTLVIRILDNGTARAIAWGASFASKGATLPTTTTISKLLTVGLMYNTVTSDFECLAVAEEV